MTAAENARNLARRVEALRTRATGAHPCTRAQLHNEAADLAQYAERVARCAAVVQQMNARRAAVGGGAW